MRNALGQFVAGHTGNPGGRPKDEHKVAELARSYMLEALGIEIRSTEHIKRRSLPFMITQFKE